MRGARRIATSPEALPSSSGWLARAPSAPAARAERPPLGVITTGRPEQRLWQRANGCAPPRLGVSAGTGDGAVSALDEVLREQVSGLVSFGIAAALAPAVEPGDLVVADVVAAPDGGSLASDVRWRRALVEELRAAGLAPLEARLAGADVLPGHTAERFRRFQATFAAAIDTESHLVAAAAHASGLPFVAIRVVVDRLKQPTLATPALVVTPGGRWRRGIGQGLRRPWELASALRGSRDLDQALAVLARAVPALARTAPAT